MNHILALGLLTASTVVIAQTPQIRSGSTIYIEPMGGYGTFLAASFMKEKVPVVIVTQKDRADYLLAGGAVHSEPNHPAVVVNNSATASINDGETPNQQAWNQGWAQGQQAAAARAAAKAAMRHSDVRISIVDAKSAQIVFAYSAEKNGSNQIAKTAEVCAKHLREFIKKSEKKS